MSRLLVTGGTGAVGAIVARQLATAGHDVRVLARHPPIPALLPHTVAVQLGDITDERSVGRACANIDVVVHLAALLHTVTADSSEFDRVNVQGTASLLAAARTEGARRVVLCSSIAVYGGNRGMVCTEETPLTPDSPYALSKQRAESLALESHSRGLPVTILRLAAVYGSRMKGNYARLVSALASRRFIGIGSGTNRRTLVHELDVASAVLQAVDHPRAAGRVFNVSDGDCHSLRQIIDAICAALGRPVPRLSVPLPVARAAAACLDPLTSALGRPLRVMRAIDKYTEDVAIAGARIQDELGFRPAFGLRTGWQRTVDELRSVGRLPARDPSR